MSARRIILAYLPSFCQKLSKLVEIWRSSGKNNIAQFFWDTVYNPVTQTSVKPNIVSIVQQKFRN